MLGSRIWVAMSAGHFETDLARDERDPVVAGGQIHDGVRHPPRVDTAVVRPFLT